MALCGALPVSLALASDPRLGERTLPACATGVSPSASPSWGAESSSWGPKGHWPNLQRMIPEQAFDLASRP